jgi:hypothetical protein
MSPHFPPVDLPDMHRVRVSLQYFREFDWNASILTDCEWRFSSTVVVDECERPYTSFCGGSGGVN